MSFWNTSTGESAITGSNEYETADGFILIPDNSNVLAYVKDAGINDKWDSHYYFVEWSVLKPESVAGARITQKFYVIDGHHKRGTKDPKKDRDNALRLLGTIDTNAGGRLASLPGAPEDKHMKVALINKEMVIKVKVWEMDGKEGNWVKGVYPKTKEIGLTGEVRAKKSTPKPDEDDWGSSSSGGFGDTSAWGEDLEDEIPF